MPRSSRSKARCSTATRPTLDTAVARAQDKVRQMGVWAPNHPVEFGGLGLSMVEHGLLSEALGRSPLGHLIFGVQAPDAGNVEILHRHATDEQRERYLRPLVEGKIRSCFSMTEPEMPGSNPVMMGTTAVKDGERLRHQRPEVVHVVCRRRRLRHRHGRHRPGRAAAPAGQHDPGPDRHAGLQPRPQHQRDGRRRVGARQPRRDHLPVLPGSAVQPARRRRRRLHDRPGAPRTGPHPPLHALARHRQSLPST